MRRPSFIEVLSDEKAYCDVGCMGATDVATLSLDGRWRARIAETSVTAWPAPGSP